MEKAPLIVLSGPSGTGKSTLVQRLLDGEEPRLRLSVSATTRAPRSGEIDGRHYHFWSREEFERAIEAGAFLEWADVFGDLYGTPKDAVEELRNNGVAVLLEIDVQGAAQIREKCPEAVFIFLRAPSLQEYERRLRCRGTESEEAIAARLGAVQRELACAGEFDRVVINDDLDKAVEEVRDVVHSVWSC